MTNSLFLHLERKEAFKADAGGRHRSQGELLMRSIIVSMVLLLTTVLPAAALDVPKAHDYVNDKANVISDTVELKLNQFLRQFEQSDSTQIVVLTISTLEGEST